MKYFGKYYLLNLVLKIFLKFKIYHNSSNVVSYLYINNTTKYESFSYKDHTKHRLFNKDLKFMK